MLLSLVCLGSASDTLAPADGGLETSYQKQSLILLAPLLVTLLPLIDLRTGWRVYRDDRTGTLLTLSGVIFGAGIGLIKHPGPTVILSAVMWIGPMVLCVFAASIRDKEMLWAGAYQNISWVVLVMGLYQFTSSWSSAMGYLLAGGSKQRFVLPSFGHPEPFGIRVWSTMNSPGSLLVPECGLDLVSHSERPSGGHSKYDGICRTLLVLVRTAWLMTVLGLSSIS